MYLVPVWALFSSVRSRMGWALVSSRVSPSGFVRGAVALV